MKKDTLITVLCVLTVGTALAGLGLILANMFMNPRSDLLPWGLGFVVFSNALNLIRTVLQKKK